MFPVIKAEDFIFRRVKLWDKATYENQRRKAEGRINFLLMKGKE